MLRSLVSPLGLTKPLARVPWRNASISSLYRPIPKTDCMLACKDTARSKYASYGRGIAIAAVGMGLGIGLLYSQAVIAEEEAQPGTALVHYLEFDVLICMIQR